MGEEFVLEMNHITKTFPGVKALDDVSLKVRKGQFMHLWVRMEQENPH